MGGPPLPNPERMLAHAFEFDADKDEKLSKEELKKFIDAFIAHRPGPGGPGRAGEPPEPPDRPQRPERPGRPERPERSE